MTTSELSRATGLGPRNSFHSVNSVGVLDRHALIPGVVSDANLPDLELDRFLSVTEKELERPVTCACTCRKITLTINSH